MSKPEKAGLPNKDGKVSSIALKEFFEIIPPGKKVKVTDKVLHQQSYKMGMTIVGNLYYVSLPTIQLHCSTKTCDGIRFFGPDSDKLWLKPETPDEATFVRYRCKNCDKTHKLFAIVTMVRGNHDGLYIDVLKVGEDPPFGPPVPSRVISLIGPDRENFLKGRHSENQGLGIGAFAYYRRIVEDHKDRILDELISACKKLATPPEIIKDLENVKRETQFAKAIDSIKPGLPESLLLDGRHNPLTLLHAALSGGLHGETDEECLELAQHIRVVLTELAERVTQVLSQRGELDSAVSKLLKRGSSKKP